MVQGIFGKGVLKKQRLSRYYGSSQKSWRNCGRSLRHINGDIMEGKGYFLYR